MWKTLWLPSNSLLLFLSTPLRSLLPSAYYYNRVQTDVTATFGVTTEVTATFYNQALEKKLM